jgi:eukaryotic-like serine/threonine-protein kinase
MMMLSTQFCAACGAANEAEQTHCFACGRSLSVSTDAPTPQDSSLFHERYRIETLLGSGGYSTVYRARDLQAEREVAIKQINLQGLGAEEAIEATDTFNREASVLSSLHHPQIPQMYDQFNDQDHWYLVLQYLEGPTLETYLETRETQGQPLQLDEVLRIALQLGKVLNYLHTRQPPVIFRDLKPSNIIRTPSHGTLCLVDFGIARRFRPGQRRDTQALGSPGYAAPEQYGRAQTTPRSDVYSLGALMHRLLSGNDPAETLPGLAPLRLRSEVGEDTLSELVQRMLSADPEQRPATMGEVIEILEAIQLQRVTEQGTRIWQPPVPQDLPSSSTGWQQVQIQVPGASSASSMPVSKGPALKRRRGPSRRKVLIGMRAALLVAAVGGVVWWASTPPDDLIVTSRPTFKKLSDTAYEYLGHTDSVASVTWSPEGQYIASGSADSSIQVWNANTGEISWTYRTDQQNKFMTVVKPVVWSPDGRSIAASFDVSESPIMQVWDANIGNTKFFYYEEGDTTFRVKSLAWSPDSKHIATGSDDQAVRVWTAITVTNDAVLLSYWHDPAKVYGFDVDTVAWSPDGKYIASGGEDRIVQISDATTGKIILTCTGHTASVNSLAWSPDGKYIVSASNDQTAQIWDAATGDMVWAYSGHTDSVNSVAWSPDSKYVASGSDDNTVQVWEATNGETIFTYRGHTARVNSVAWSSDGSRIASGSDDKTVQIWKVKVP